MVTCKKCSAVFDEKFVICPKCGTAYEGEGPAAPVEPEQTSVFQSFDMQNQFVPENRKVSEKPAKKKKSKGKLIAIIAVVCAVIIGAAAAVFIIMSQNNGNELSDQISLGEKYLSEENYDDAIDAFKKAIELEPNDPELYKKLADSYIGKGDIEGAIQALEEGYSKTKDESLKTRLEVLKKEKQYNELMESGQKLLADSKYTEAAGSFKQAAEIKVKEEKPYLLAAEGYIGNSDYNDAKTILEKGYSETNSEQIRKKLKELEDMRYEAKLTIDGVRHTYRLIDQGMTWEEAEKYCKDNGGYLLTITSQEEQDTVKKLISNGNKKSYWLGGAIVNGTPVWSTGEQFGYSNWAVRQPDNFTGSENRLMIYNKDRPEEGSHAGEWNDLQEDGMCGREKFFGLENFGLIMETGEVKQQKAENKIPDDAYTYNGHSYYIFDKISDKWEIAEKYCESMGGYLAVINDEKENNALFKYMKRKGCESAYFGYSDAEEEGSWKWVNNKKSDYKNWADGEPNNENDSEHYAMFYYKYEDGQWNDGSFSGSTERDVDIFICEWDYAPKQQNYSSFVKAKEVTAREKNYRTNKYVTKTMDIPQLDIHGFSDQDAINKEINDKAAATEGDTGFAYNVTYEVFSYQNVLSLVITCQYRPWHDTAFLAYNIDMNTKKLMTGAEVLETVGITEKEYLENDEDFLSLAFCRKYGTTTDEDGNIIKEGKTIADVREKNKDLEYIYNNIDKVYAKTLNFVRNKDVTRPKYIDNNGDLYVCVEMGSFAGAEGYSEMIKYELE